MTNEHARQIQRCDWCIHNAVYMAYHDKEWGIPAHNDNKLFEFLILEGTQAGLSCVICSEYTMRRSL